MLRCCAADGFGSINGRAELVHDSIVKARYILRQMMEAKQFGTAIVHSRTDKIRCGVGAHTLRTWSADQ